ncbi:MAG: 50S ribosomal protein L23 [Parcubacteria group bacterium CG1_02_36_42]|nr:MAG: 50S ribosomal protein L23 [Parcubacteria group bacterium CG1_02_36_42]
MIKEKESIKIYQILKAPHITEKTTNLAEKNQYVFRVWQKANKNEIKKAIENLYKVKVMDVKIINVPAKRRRLGRISGWRKGYKKAIVRLKEGQKIEVLPR